MNQDSPGNLREELEARLTALLLGELPDDEVAMLRAAIEQDAGLAGVYERLKHTIDLVRETAVSPTEEKAAHPTPLRLSEERRQRLLARFKTITPKEFVAPRRRKSSWLVPLGAAAALLLLAAIVTPNFTRARESSQANAIINNLRILEGARDQWALENKKGAGDVPTFADLGDYLKGGSVKSVAGEKYVIGTTGVTADFDAAEAKKRFGGWASKQLPRPERGQRARLSADAEWRLAGKNEVADATPQSGTVFTYAGAGDDPAKATEERLLFAKPLTQSKGGPSQAETLRADRSGAQSTTPPVELKQSVRGAEAVNVASAGRQEIVLPSAGKPADAPTEQLETRLFRADPNAFGQALETVTGAPLRNLASAGKEGAGGIGGGGAGDIGGTKSQGGIFDVPPVYAAGRGIAGGGGFGGGVLGQGDLPGVTTAPNLARDNQKKVRGFFDTAGVNAQPGQLHFNDNSDALMAWATPEDTAPKAINSLNAPAPRAQNEGLPHSDSNRFVARYAYTPLPATEPTAIAPSTPAPGIAGQSASAVNVEAKLAELGQKDDKALGFDWYANGGLKGDSNRFIARSFLMDPQFREVTVAGSTPATTAPSPVKPSQPKEPESIRLLERNDDALGAKTANVPAQGEVSVDGDAKNMPFYYNRLMMERYGLVPKGAPPTAKDKTTTAAPSEFGLAPSAAPQRPGKDFSGRGDSAKPVVVANRNSSSIVLPSAVSAVEEKAFVTPDPKSRQVDVLAEGKSALDGTIRELERQLEQRNEEVEGAQAKVDEFRRKLNISDNSTEGALPAKRLEAQTVRSREDSVEAAKRQQEVAKYAEANSDLDNLQKMRNAVFLRTLQEKIDAALPKTSIVEITDLASAQPAKSPTLWERARETVTGNVERTARIAVEKDTSDITPLGFAQNSTQYDPFSIQTEFEKIRSTKVLNKVIEKLNLNEAWGKKRGSGGKLKTEETYKLLNDRIDVRQNPNGSLIDITVKSDKPDEAARIANTVAEVYRDTRQALRRELSAGGVAALEKEIAEHDKRIASARQEAERLEKESNIQQAAQVKEEDRPVRRPPPDAPVPQPEVQTRDNAYSTFSLNVSDVSFKLTGASLEKGVMPEAASVRSEEFINAFDYRDPEPTAGVPIAFAWERARYPFAHNRDLLRFSVKTAAAGRQAGRPLNIVLLLDNSGSMERADRVQIIREALRVLASQLQPQDKFSVITFARTARLWVDGVPGNQAGEVAEQVSRLTPQGGTNLEDAMNLAYQTALRHYLAEGVNRVVLLTDGAANLGDVEPESLKQKVEAHRKQGVALDCFGIGWEGFNDDLLEVLSRNGDGRYGFINSPEEAATEFAGQLAGALQVAASDVKVQVEFNPRRVTAYRQIGYAKHQLTKEQFRDNTVDAAEIAAAEAGNALYTVEVNPAGAGPLAVVRVRFKLPGTTDYREHEWAVPFTGNAAPLEQVSSAMRLAATASAFSEWLVSSPFAGEVTPDRLLGYLSGVPEVYGADARPKKLEWMIRQAKSISGK